MKWRATLALLSSVIEVTDIYFILFSHLNTVTHIPNTSSPNPGQSPTLPATNNNQLMRKCYQHNEGTLISFLIGLFGYLEMGEKRRKSDRKNFNLKSWIGWCNCFGYIWFIGFLQLIEKRVRGIWESKRPTLEP